MVGKLRFFHPSNGKAPRNISPKEMSDLLISDSIIRPELTGENSF
jgi:hypothetical protein